MHRYTCIHYLQLLRTAVLYNIHVHTVTYYDRQTFTQDYCSSGVLKWVGTPNTNGLVTAGEGGRELNKMNQMLQIMKSTKVQTLPIYPVTVVCVTTVIMPVHLHGTNFAPFLLLTRRCYDAETSAILLLLKRAFA